MKVLVQFEADWADEFDIHGLKVFNSLEAWENYYRENVVDCEFSFGTNEAFEPGDITESDFKISFPSEAEMAVITKFFGTEWGHFPG